ncbi:MAG: PatB family C-S lyase [Lentimicrobium sp.]|nr:PatB family C-S lyase [Lentimicrobium sp.]
MPYNFDQITPRSNTNSVKYDLRKLMFGKEDILPMWVADMDFRTPDFVMNAIRKRAEHEILGYTIRSDSYFTALIDWLLSRHQWEVRKEWIAFSPGIVPALNLLVLGLTKRRDRIIIQPPVYFPFFNAVKDHGRKLVFNNLILKDGRYFMDFQLLEKQCREGAAMLILCNPHNPGGTAWTRDELETMAGICLKYNVLMVSDEIHGDLVNIGFKHTVLAAISPEIAMQTITLTAPSKTFNLAGMSTASVITANEKLMKKYKRVIGTLHMDMGNIFGNVAAEAAYLYGDQWLGELLDYLHGNINFLIKFANENLPQVEVMYPEATYMAWLNFGKTGMNDEQLMKFVVDYAGLGLNAGKQFGPGGEGFMRLNFACPRSLLEKALMQLKGALLVFEQGASKL